MTQPKPGTAIRAYIYTCSLCMYQTAIPSMYMDAAHKKARNAGWKYIKARGWTCGHCITDQALRKTGAIRIGGLTQ